MGDFNTEQYEEAIIRKGEAKRDKIAEELFNLLEARGLVDAFKWLNPKRPGYTWKSRESET